MQALKIIGLTFLSFIIFISLVVFSIAFMANGTVLTPKFITRELDSIDVSASALSSWVSA
jgi:hypothetical protein